jgi:hypothetical protein
MWSEVQGLWWGVGVIFSVVGDWRDGVRLECIEHVKARLRRFLCL